MNDEVIKAMNRKVKSHPIKAWWRKYSHIVWRVLLFPIWVIDLLNQKLDTREEWSEARANRIFNYYIPRYAQWSEEEKAFYFFDNGYGWNPCFAKKKLKVQDRRFWKVHHGFEGGQLREYLIEKFELDGFQKSLGNCSNGWTDISFKLIEKKG